MPKFGGIVKECYRKRNNLRKIDVRRSLNLWIAEKILEEIEINPTFAETQIFAREIAIRWR
jgi:hypothetical protein